jgi:hypothetical protein
MRDLQLDVSRAFTRLNCTMLAQVDANSKFYAAATTSLGALVVLDLGRVYCKFGLAGEPRPRGIIPYVEVGDKLHGNAAGSSRMVRREGQLVAWSATQPGRSPSSRPCSPSIPLTKPHLRIGWRQHYVKYLPPTCWWMHHACACACARIPCALCTGAWPWHPSSFTNSTWPA